MKSLLLISVLLCGTLCGVLQSKHTPTKEAIICEVKEMIDNNILNSKYVKIVNWGATDKGDIYKINLGKCPVNIGNWLPPMKVISYKSRYICYIDFYANDWLSQRELKALLGKDSIDVFYWKSARNLEDSDTTFLVGIPNDSSPATVVQADTKNPHVTKTCFMPYIYPAFNSYFWKEQTKDSSKIVFTGYDIFADTAFRPGNSLKGHIKYLCGILVYFTEGTKSYYADNRMGNLSYFVTINGKDTLKYEQPDTIENHFILNSQSCSKFFKRISEENSWEYLDHLLRDSTFYVRQRGKNIEYIPVVYYDGPFTHSVHKQGDSFISAFTRTNYWTKSTDFFMKWQEEP